MNTETGWIKLYRSMAQWEWSDDPNTLSLFLHLLIMANREDGRWHGIVIKRGEVLTSLGKLAKLVGVSVQSIRTALTHLKSTQEITQFPHGNYTHISINNWESYQQTNTVANILPTARQQLANNKQEVKKIRSKEIDTFMSLFNSLFGGKYQPTAGRVA